ncbi:Uncharacterized protein Rs2_08479 [Raphanus sativus]|nr:Uncharacterized protein Rs2_08479 [Raphanus sativus]
MDLYTCTDFRSQLNTRPPSRLDRPPFTQPPQPPPTSFFAGAPTLQSLRATITVLRCSVFTSEGSPPCETSSDSEPPEILDRRNREPPLYHLEPRRRRHETCLFKAFFYPKCNPERFHVEKSKFTSMW